MSKESFGSSIETKNAESLHRDFLDKHANKLKALLVGVTAVGVGVFGGHEIMTWVQETSPGMLDETQGTILGIITTAGTGIASGMAVKNILDKFKK